MTASVVTTFNFITPSFGFLNIFEPVADTDNLLFFVRGNSLLGSDGTETGTFEITNFGNSFSSGIVSQDSTNISRFLGINGQLFFVVLDNETGEEIWTSNGTAEGTTLLRDINPLGSSQPRDFIRVGDILFFTAFDEENGRALWRSDGTTEGTQLVQDISSVTGVVTSPSPFRSEFVDVNGTLFFTATTAPNGLGFGVFKSDGTAEGTQLVRAFDRDFLEDFVALGDTLFFDNNDNRDPGLWKSDGTPESTQLVAAISGDELTAVGDTLFFTANDGVNGRELWTSDGTPEGTQMLLDIRPEERVSGSPINLGSDPEDLINVNGTLFFTADDGVNGRELWTSDGTPEGTQLVKNITEGFTSTSFDNFTVVNDTLYFTSALELWQSDGTEIGTIQIEPEQIAVGGDQFTDSFRLTSGSSLVEFNDELIFSGFAYSFAEGGDTFALLSLSNQI
ncbi:hypothetical protein Xen7305DRAFT_00039960 [Xenococcus sp. PCC 7305]|uniref:ELWxxDGT repeat protein n=1 Tax=Xenococcus sp. PCC 7305 TaxID=102125 RepID=UPI0002ABBD8B|nr:ELWxxDGT repeat protein [Xenococcus sp. PCC 7305]ELS04268.1 hypothetical protein Xen7305DRAFT_00039960 [Xenococcus sp. PCC 7305]